MNNDKGNLLRLSIDFHSIKNCSFTGYLYFRHKPLDQYNIPSFMNNHLLEVQKPNEYKILDGFRQYIFHLLPEQISSFEQEKLELECWHKNIDENDVKLGQCLIDFKNIMESPVRQVESIFVKTLSQFYPLNNEYQKKIADIHVVLYLEDLGPQGYLEQTPQEVHKLALKLKKPTINMQEDLQSLEQRIIWELEQWQIKQQNDFLNNLKLQEEFAIQDLIKEIKIKSDAQLSEFETTNQQYSQLENNLKVKEKELAKREAKITLLEDEQKHKLLETQNKLEASKYILKTLQKEITDSKAVYEKEIKKIEQNFIIRQKIQSVESQIALQKEQIKKFNQEQLKSPLQLIKNEINSKIQEIKLLEKELEKTQQTKEQYKDYYTKLKEGKFIRLETMTLKQQFDSYKLEQQKHYQEEINEAKQYLQSMPNNNEDQILKQLQDELLKLKASIKQEETKQDNDEQVFSEKEKLIQERDYLLRCGYSLNDAVIRQYSIQIQRLQT